MKMKRTMEQTVNVKFCIKLQKWPSEMLETLKAVYNDSTMSKSNVFMWHKRFREGRIYANNDEMQDTPVELGQSDHRLTCRTIADELDMSKERTKGQTSHFLHGPCGTTSRR
jgi:hypothetical protein